ncbi:MAG TPA: cyclic pyranopterin monophosphate synthase MoaC [Fibrobacteres bacterium]|jgi:cyclic pyranopterin monophosphate synthase|nr:cyclic pyranopterin monophosphate synthase MoaC [Fibrobacterota bacterium]
MELTHINRKDGSIRMVDISAKPPVKRIAVAAGTIRMKPETITLLKKGLLKKGDPLVCAQIAGIMAAKKTCDLIPLCHQISLEHVGLDFAVKNEEINITATALCRDSTGVEMEVLTAVSVAALTLYDMCKAVDKTMEIKGIKLLKKTKEALDE